MFIITDLLKIFTLIFQTNISGISHEPPRPRTSPRWPRARSWRRSVLTASSSPGWKPVSASAPGPCSASSVQLLRSPPSARLSFLLISASLEFCSPAPYVPLCHNATSSASFSSSRTCDKTRLSGEKSTISKCHRCHEISSFLH